MSYPFNHIGGVNPDKTLKVVIEIPKGSHHKVEWDRKAGYFILDRIEPPIFAKPANYGFIPQTLDQDGDELDALVVSESPLPLGVVVPRAKVLGVIKYTDDGEADHKIICVPGDDRHSGDYQHLDDLGKVWLDQIIHHFKHMKDLKKPGSVSVDGIGDAAEAWQVIRECQEQAQQQPWW